MYTLCCCVVKRCCLPLHVRGCTHMHVRPAISPPPPPSGTCTTLCSLATTLHHTATTLKRYERGEVWCGEPGGLLWQTTPAMQSKQQIGKGVRGVRAGNRLLYGTFLSRFKIWKVRAELEVPPAKAQCSPFANGLNALSSPSSWKGSSDMMGLTKR
jgi:hypothetical protein